MLTAPQLFHLRAGFLCSVGVEFLLGAPWLVTVFTDDVEVARHAVSYLRIVSLGFPFYAYGMVVSQSFNGAGDTRTPTIINLFVFWALQIPLAWALFRYTHFGPAGVFATLAFSFSIFAMVSVFAFRRGSWNACECDRAVPGEAACETARTLVMSG